MMSKKINKIDKELNEKVEEEYKYILNSVRNIRIIIK